MSNVTQSLCITRHSPSCWALWLGLLVAAALPLLGPQPQPAHFPGAMSFFASNQTEALSFIEDHATSETTVMPMPAVEGVEQAAPLFGMDTEPLLGGMVSEKWSRVKAEVDRELEAVDRCRATSSCSGFEEKLIDLSAEGAGRSGRARVGLINRAVDRAISPVSDEAQWGVPDHWSAPFETIRSGRGDCEDYAIVKYATLLEAGMSRDDVKIVILKNIFPSEDHAVVAVRVDHQWLILDNRTLTLVRDTDVTRAIPEFVLDDQGVRRFSLNSGIWKAAG
jgi:predicted transglutaminase-like cysteine proteinase